MQPYRRGRIPVVLVHGTDSSSGRWADMVNDLMNDPRIREHFQFWYFTYDSGNPILYSAAGLRELLTAAVARLDPEGTDPALHRMVVIGHSQGGLLTKLTAVDAGDKFWGFKTSIDEMKMSDETRELLRRLVFVKPLPFVKRVVFIATPHGGSYVAGNWIAHQIARLIKMPGQILDVGAEIVKGNPDLANWRVPSAVDNMTPAHPLHPRARADAGRTRDRRELDRRGERRCRPTTDGTDGVVKYVSAHRTDCRVRAGRALAALVPVESDDHRRGAAHPAAAPRRAVDPAPGRGRLAAVPSTPGQTRERPVRRDRADRVGRHLRSSRPATRSEARAPRAASASTAAMKASCPSSTPTLKQSRASGIACGGRPTSASAPAKPSPCSRPKVNATSQGRRAVRPGRPAGAVHDLGRDEHDAERDHRLDRRRRHVHEAQRSRRRASGCARRVKAVTVVTSRRVGPTSMKSARTKSRWSKPSRMCSTPRPHVRASRRRAGRCGASTVNAGVDGGEPHHLGRAVRRARRAPARR